jgi:hypothetical protein
MGHDLATAAELVKLARALGATPAEVGFAKSLGYEEVHQLRERVTSALYEEHRVAYQRVAQASKLLPTALLVKVALRAFPPLLAARVAAEMPSERAAELANRMPIEYLADVCVQLDPARAAPLITRIAPDRALAVAGELVGRGEHLTLGQLVDAASERIVRDVAANISDEALLWIGFYAESGKHLTHAVGALPPERLRGVVDRALNGPAKLRSAGLALIGRLDDDELRRLLGDHAAAADDEVLTALLRTAIEDGAVAELLSVVASMSEPAQRRVLALPVLAERDVLVHLVKATAAHDLWGRLLPLVEHMDDGFRTRLTQAWRDSS